MVGAAARRLVLISVEATLRVLSYNVRSLRDDREALTRVIRGCEPDVVCVQEAPRFFGWRKAARDLGLRVGLSVLTGGADASGNLLLGGRGVRLVSTETVYLRHIRGLHLRGMAMASVEVDSARCVVASTHLSLDEDQRREQAGEVLGHLDRFTAASGATARVLAGDFNSHPGSPVWQTLGADLDDAWERSPHGEEFTSTAANPYQRLDAVFVSRDVAVERAGVPVDLVTPRDVAAASDHRPVLAVLRIPRGSAPR
jgi:endonuclease/exonuclease/phosphatase family metal-dependent hydrolase